MQDNLKKIRSYILSWQQKLKSLVSMAREKFSHEECIVGIDVGTSAVKVIQMANVDGAMTVVKSALVDIGGLPGNQEEALASLKTAMIGIDTKGAKVVAIVGCPQTCTRKIIAPHMPKKELDQAVRWEAKNAIPFSIDDALMDFEILDEVSEKGVRKLIMAVAAAPKETVDKLLSLFFKAGIEVSALIPISSGLQNLIAHSKEKDQEIKAIVEMGASVTELNIYREGQLAFSRKLPVAGNDITKAMTSTLMSAQGKVELSGEDAEKIKREQGVPDGAKEELVDGKILPSQILSLVRPCVEQLAGEIERAFDFYREESRGGQVNRIVLFGGGSSLKRLPEFLKQKLEVDVVIGDSFEGMKILPGAVNDQKSVASRFDLAIGAVFNKIEKINLLPIELKEKTKRFIGDVSLKGAAVGIIVSLLLLYVGSHIQLHSYNKKMAALQLEQRTLAPQLEKLRANMLIGGILKDEPYWEDVLKELSAVVPPEMYLTDFSMSDNQIRLMGDIISGDGIDNAQSILSRFMLTLEEGMFRDVSLVTTQKKQANANISNFEITCKIE